MIIHIKKTQKYHREKQLLRRVNILLINRYVEGKAQRARCATLRSYSEQFTGYSLSDFVYLNFKKWFFSEKSEVNDYRNLVYKALYVTINYLFEWQSST